jgi:GTP-binding protein LepA
MWLQHVITNQADYRLSSVFWIWYQRTRRRCFHILSSTRSSNLSDNDVYFHQYQNQHSSRSSKLNLTSNHVLSYSSHIKQQRKCSSLSTTNDNHTHHNSVSIVSHLHLIEQIPIEDVRNFCFIAHVDHGKSSLSMRILELTGNLGNEAQHDAYQAAISFQEVDKLNKDNKNSIQHNKDSMTDAFQIDNNVTSTDTSKNDDKANSKERIDMLDSLNVEQQRGITVKASTATMLYQHPSAIGPTGLLLLNMYDTPGHVDFNKEVTRTLQFVQGAVLLLDATQGIQAQTWSVYDKVKLLQKQEQELLMTMQQQQQEIDDNVVRTHVQQQQYQQAPELIIALTKVDLESARPIHVALSVSEFFHWDDPDTIIQTSARSRYGIKKLLDSICQHVPSPKVLLDDNHDSNKTTAGVLRAQVVDSWYDTRGVNCLVRIISGKLSEGDRIAIIPPILEKNQQINDTTSSVQQNQAFPVQEVGILLPKSYRTGTLMRGQMGYVRFGLRDPRQALPGTVVVWHSNLNQKMILPQFCYDNLITKSVLYASVHPEDVSEFENLCNAVEKLALNDTGLEVSKASVGSSSSSSDNSDSNAKSGPYLGPGIRVGFQGLLHVEVFRQRLHDEYNINAIVTPPKVPYTIIIQPSKSNNLNEPITKVIEDLSEWVCVYEHAP